MHFRQGAGRAGGRVDGRARERSATAARLAAIRRLLDEAREPSVVDGYLARRGLSVGSPALRGHPRCLYVDDDRNPVGRFPATIAPVTGPDGALLSAHRIYSNTELDPRKKLMPKVADLAGAAVRLHQPADVLGVAEGVETALAAFQMFGIPTWAAISDSGVKAFKPPPGIERLVIFADHDLNFAGQAAAYDLAKRVARDGIACEVRIPPIAGTDWLDALNAQAARP